MVLCRWRGEWLLASKVNPDTPSCALVGGAWPRLSELGFQHESRAIGHIGQPNYSERHIWHRFMPQMNDIVFYPRLRYHEMRVSPEWWHPDSTEPLLYCVTGADSWRRPIHTEAELNEMIAEFKGDGWDYTQVHPCQ